MSFLHTDTHTIIIYYTTRSDKTIVARIDRTRTYQLRTYMTPRTVRKQYLHLQAGWIDRCYTPRLHTSKSVKQAHTHIHFTIIAHLYAPPLRTVSLETERLADKLRFSSTYKFFNDNTNKLNRRRRKRVDFNEIEPTPHCLLDTIENPNNKTRHT